MKLKFPVIALWATCCFCFVSATARSTDTIPTIQDFRTNRHLVSRMHPADSADVSLLSHKAFWRAAAETFGMNMSLWAFDRYVQKGHFAYISLNTIKENFKHGFEWDDDHLSTNMFAHPYNGSVFFNAGRSNGYDFWQSELFAIGGSAMWEMFMECEYPSTNDIIATPIGGAAIGEILYRTSDLIIDDKATDYERFGRELAAFVVNPMRGFTRVVTGRAWQRRSTPGRHFGIPPTFVDLSMGMRYLALTGDDSGHRTGGALEINIEYGDRYAPRTKAPYDYFSFILELNAMKTQPLISRAEIVGRLLSRQIVDKPDLNASLGMFQHFDYFDSDTIKRRRPETAPWVPCVVPYKLGTPASVGAGAMLQYKPSPAMVIDAYAHVNGVLLAGILTDFYRDYHRNYNWGSGLSVKTGLNVSLMPQKLALFVANQYYLIYTWNGYNSDKNWTTSPDGMPVNVQGDASRASFNHFEANFRYTFWKRMSLNLGIDFYRRLTRYTNMKIEFGNVWTTTPIIESRQIGSHLMLSYEF